jgi:hypothetical protein
MHLARNKSPTAEKCYWAGNRIGNAVLRKQIRLQSESIVAAVCLGLMIAGVNTLIVIGLFIVFA